VGDQWGTWGVRQLGILEAVGESRKGASLFVGALMGGSSLGIWKEGTGDGRHSFVLGDPFTGNSEG
jgi:hypothetical protein